MELIASALFNCSPTSAIIAFGLHHAMKETYPRLYRDILISKFPMIFIVFILI